MKAASAFNNDKNCSQNVRASVKLTDWRKEIWKTVYIQKTDKKLFAAKDSISKASYPQQNYCLIFMMVFPRQKQYTSCYLLVITPQEESGLLSRVKKLFEHMQNNNQVLQHNALKTAGTIRRKKIWKIIPPTARYVSKSVQRRWFSFLECQYVIMHK